MKMFFCKKCLMPSTRPRIQFNDEGVCNACVHHERKMKEIDWKQRWSRLEELCDSFRSKDGSLDVIVPCSGGKDGSYVSWRMKHDLGMHPIGVTCRPLMPTRIGERNLESYILSGFDHFKLSPNPETLRLASKKGFIEQGRPWHAFDTYISTAVFQIATRFGIPFIMYGEEGEQEYGGATNAKEKIDRDYLLNYYYSGHDPSEYGSWWKMPSQEDLDKLYPTHWSKFEDWDPQIHAQHAKKYCGLEMLVGGSIGTFTNYASLDDLTRDLHVYLQFTKFGFGRCVADASVEIRRGRMTRDQGVEVCSKIDGAFPVEMLPAYLDYYDMGEKEFWALIDKYVDYDVLYKTGSIERPYELKDEYKKYNLFKK